MQQGSPPINEQAQAARENAGLTQQQLAARCRCHRSSISRAEAHGPAVPSASIYQRIADATGTPLTLVHTFTPRARRSRGSRGRK